MAVGGGSWAARSRVPPPNSLQIAAPPISGLLQVSASFLRRRVPEERTSLDLPGLPAPLAFRPRRAVPRLLLLLLTAEKYQTATQTTRPTRNVGGIETQTGTQQKASSSP